MKISTKSRKAIESILDVAVLGEQKPVTLAEIGKRRRISVSYLEQIFRMLREHDLVRSTRGPGGGYQLKRRLSAISVADVVSAVDEDVPPPVTSNRGSRDGGDNPSMRVLWTGLNDHLQNYLSTVTLASMLDNNGRSGSASGGGRNAAGKTAPPGGARARSATPRSRAAAGR